MGRIARAWRVLKRRRFQDRQLWNVIQFRETILAQIHPAEAVGLQGQELRGIGQHNVRGVWHLHIPDFRQRRGLADGQRWRGAEVHLRHLNVKIINRHRRQRFSQGCWAAVRLSECHDRQLWLIR